MQIVHKFRDNSWLQAVHFVILCFIHKKFVCTENTASSAIHDPNAWKIVYFFFKTYAKPFFSNQNVLNYAKFWNKNIYLHGPCVCTAMLLLLFTLFINSSVTSTLYSPSNVLYKINNYINLELKDICVSGITKIKYYLKTTVNVYMQDGGGLYLRILFLLTLGYCQC